MGHDTRLVPDAVLIAVADHVAVVGDDDVDALPPQRIVDVVFSGSSDIPLQSRRISIPPLPLPPAASPLCFSISASVSDSPHFDADVRVRARDDFAGGDVDALKSTSPYPCPSCAYGDDGGDGDDGVGVDVDVAPTAHPCRPTPCPARTPS